LVEGDFQVVDQDATDGVGAFQLPAPGINCEEDTSDKCVDDNADYYVYARVLGKPTPGTFDAVTCATELQDIDNDGELEEVCSLESISLPNSNGPGKKAKFTNVTKELLTLCLDVSDTGDDDGFDGICDIRVDIFDNRLEDYVWDMTNDGKRLVQLRFIDQPPAV
jgi:hypothetical protein